MAEINQAMAANLWENLEVTIDRFHSKITPHPKSTFLGYADVTLDVVSVPGMTLKLRGIEVKELKSNPHLDMPSEKGADGTFYPRFFPRSAELRAVLTRKIFRHQDVLATVEAAKRAHAEAQGNEAQATASADNPFSG